MNDETKLSIVGYAATVIVILAFSSCTMYGFSQDTKLEMAKLECK